MDEEQKKTFIAGLKNGHGLTRSSRLIMLDSKEVSEILIKDPLLKVECDRALLFAAKTLLIMSSTYLSKREFDKWMTSNQYTKAFIPRLVMWGDFSKGKELDDKAIVRAYHIYFDMDETATACEFFRDGLLLRIQESEILANFFTQKGII